MNVLQADTFQATCASPKSGRCFVRARRDAAAVRSTVLPADRACAGQAMVEFTLMLVIILALVVSMVWVNNLLNYDYWAQQEARYLAFEQTWVASQYYADSGDDPTVDLNNGAVLRRPGSVSRLEVDKDVSDQGGVVDLLTSSVSAVGRFLGKSPDEQRDIEERGEAPVMLAKSNSIWHAKTSDWIDSAKQKLSFVESAYASLQGSTVDPRADLTFEPRAPSTSERVVAAIDDRDSLEEGLVGYLERVEFGELFCSAMSELIDREPGATELFARQGFDFAAADCGSTYNQQFALHLSENSDPKELFRDFGFQVQQGMSTSDALESVVAEEVTNQFFSFFDQTVRISRAAAVPLITAERVEVAASGTSAEITRLITDLRYAGSSVAVVAITGGTLGQVLGLNPLNRDPLVEKNLQDSLDNILHADVPEVSYLLNPLYLPVPSSFLGASSALQAGVMENILRGGESVLGSFLGDANGDETALIGPLIDESNKRSVVAYGAGRGLFPSAARRFRGDAVLTSRFYLVTQPWHITRKETAFGPYREIGDQFDGIGQDTEEGVLRRRVAGLWLFPSAPGAFFSSFGEFLLGDSLGGVIDVVSGFDSVIANIKAILVTENPLTQISDALASIPVIGNLVPTFPKFPVVRPAAYPGSVELAGQDFAPDDQLMNERRNFQDYVDEQEYDPKPNPKFDDDIFE